jgi:hypothetical protein
MRYLQLVAGTLFVIKGICKCIALPSALAALHVDSAYSAGEATGLVIGALGILAGGVALISHGRRAGRPVAAGRRPAP